MYKRNIITIAQIKPRAGFIEGNKNKIIDFIKKVSDKSDLIIFPDLALYGYHNFDMLKKFEIINSQIKEALFEIKKNVNSCVVLLNYPLKTGEIQNVLIENNEINYIKDVFELNNTKFQIIKNENDTLDDSVNYLIYLKNEITRQNSEYFKNKKLSALAQKYSKKLIYINQTGAFDELIYEGKSRVYDEKGNIICKLGAFKEDYEILDENLKGKIIEDIKNIEKTTNLDSFSLDYENDLERCYKTIVFAIKEYFNQNNFNKAVLGLSGGLDSTICATLLADALGKENVLGVLMPSKLTSSESNDDAATLARNLGINVIVAPIKTMQETLKEEFSENFKNIDSATSFKNSRYEKSYTQDNIQARLRAMILWGISNEYDKVLPIATSDKSEAYMGYATINGDMSGSYAPILDVTKTKLFALGRWMNENRKEKNAIPESVLTKEPGAELAINPQTGKTLKAQEALMPYEFLDEVIWRIENLHQSVENMMQEEFLYEKNNHIDNVQKKKWLEKFFLRMQGALYKGYISAPGPIVDNCSINKIEYRQPIVSKIDF